jgi:hypothetical protein
MLILEATNFSVTGADGVPLLIAAAVIISAAAAVLRRVRKRSSTKRNVDLREATKLAKRENQADRPPWVP